jgi:hypothetical protein
MMILMYHRVAEVGLDPWGLNVSPDHFAEHLEVIRAYFHPLGLQALLEEHREGKMPVRSVTLTFDDGYADNLYTARPLLERYEIPATVFLITEHLAGGRNFWWDELEWALLHPKRLPERLELKINSSSCEWQLGEATRYDREDRRGDRNRRPWKALPGTRLAFFYSVWERLVPFPWPVGERCFDAIFSLGWCRSFRS